jgi:hypothetical protein
MLGNSQMKAGINDTDLQSAEYLSIWEEVRQNEMDIRNIKTNNNQKDKKKEAKKM